ncbi:diketogulonate reductase-like aldo/keto reductase [Gracilibacillus halotolerans]|uniref:Diketogulonate reductase-like aldo/keto reductase n=1 Tax=Gracilibacillus halotolerans TaxID=74386 RepID=A0A841RQ53_9BACI|nr:aldo/keto reductase [Gracilibacillus halotolerans]MBB6512778.1 diketogulonate reductase-like aldo/keto reductase [Gracilibacillus halotolerans]
MENQLPEVTLNDGLRIPVLGFGTARLKGIEAVSAVTSAIHAGYRMIDTAYNYENEGAIGEAIRRGNVSREKLRITSKLPGRYHAYKDAVKAIQESLFRANLDYFDLYLIHWPNPKENKYTEAWQALIDAKRWGLVRSIGLSNFLPEHIETLKEETGVLPSINQIELHPFFNQAEQREWHEKYQIKTEAWSPLHRAEDLSSNETLQSIAENYNRSLAQIVLRWHYQNGVITIPKASSPQHQLDNLSIFDFSLRDEDIEVINNLTQPDGRLNDQNPAEYQEF